MKKYVVIYQEPDWFNQKSTGPINLTQARRKVIHLKRTLTKNAIIRVEFSEAKNE